MIILPLADIVAVATGQVGPHAGLIIGLSFEAVLSVVVIAEAVAFRRAYRIARASNAGVAAAFTTGLAAALPAPVAWFLRTEAGIARALWWAVRRRSAVDPDDVALPYTDRIGVLLGMTAGLGAVEIGVVHLIIPWPTLRWVLLGLGIYGVLWVVGLAFSLRQHRHLLRGDELLLRFGHFRTTRIPLAELVSVRRDVRTGHMRNIELDDDTLSLSVAGETALELSFDSKLSIELRSRVARVARLRFFVDDPRTAVGLLRQRVVSHPR